MSARDHEGLLAQGEEPPRARPPLPRAAAEAAGRPTEADGEAGAVLGPCWAGIDPGAKGAIVVLDALGRCVLAWAADDLDAGYLRHDEVDGPAIAERLRDLHARGPIVVACLEIPLAPRAIGTSTALTIGQRWGALEMALRFAGVPVQRVSPAKWSNAMLGKPPTGGWAGAKKDAACDLVARTIPTVGLVLPRRHKRHDGLADAALIAAWARREWAEARP